MYVFFVCVYVCSSACVHVCRLARGDPALSDLVRRRDELAVWLEQAENAVSSLPVTATDSNLKELKVQRGSKRPPVSAIHGSAELSISALELGAFSYFYGHLLLCCIFLCSLFASLYPQAALCISITRKKNCQTQQTQTEPHISCFE